MITLCAAGFLLLLRPDFVDAGADRWRRYVGTPTTIADYTRANSVRKLHLGAGPVKLPGWLNTDIDPLPGQVYLDVTEKFPLEDKSFQFIFSEHLIEHLAYADGLTMLKETYRVLSPGGKMRLHTPNLDTYVDLFNPKQPDSAKRFVEQKIKAYNLPLTPEPATYILNLQMHDWGHQFLYTSKLMRARLEEAGFVDIQQVPLGASTSPAFTGISSRRNSGLTATDDYETMGFEATRP